MHNTTPNSHDDVRASKQDDKAGVKFATKAFQSAVLRPLIILLNKDQTHIKEAYDSDEGGEVRARLNGGSNNPYLSLNLSDKEIILTEPTEGPRELSTQTVIQPTRYASLA